MNLDMVYSLCSLVAVGGWLCLLAAPLARDRLIMAARAFALVLCAAYLWQFFFITESVEGGSFSTLPGIVAFFTSPGNVMLGWTHYLAFDLFIGSWEVEDAGRRGIPHWLVIPCMVFTFLLGPIGLGLYFLLRWAWGLRGRA